LIENVVEASPQGYDPCGRFTGPPPEERYDQQIASECCSSGASMFKMIDHVEIVTDRLDRTVQFCTAVLGFSEQARDQIDRSAWATN